VKQAVWFHRATAALWLILGAVAFPLGWADSVALVWIASVYANFKTDIGTANAADDRRVLDAIDELSERLARIEAAIGIKRMVR
jgi:hypothetical protein